MIILINGASGSGKTFLLSCLHKLSGYHYIPLKKYTTRSRRVFETEQPVDLVYDCDEEHIMSLAYNYSYKDSLYGIDSVEISNELAKGNIPVIIVRSFEIIHQIKQDYKDVKVLFIIGASGDNLRKKLRLQGRPTEDISVSEEGVDIITREYIDNIDDVDHCIVNLLYDEKLYLKQFLKYAV